MKKKGYWDYGLDLRGSGMESERWGAGINGGPGEAPGGFVGLGSYAERWE